MRPSLQAELPLSQPPQLFSDSDAITGHIAAALASERALHAPRASSLLPMRAARSDDAALLRAQASPPLSASFTGLQLRAQASELPLCTLLVDTVDVV